jgi:hypothetical protein
MPTGAWTISRSVARHARRQYSACLLAPQSLRASIDPTKPDHCLPTPCQVDFCGPTAGPTDPPLVSYQPGPQYDAWMTLGKALNATGRPIYYSICPHTLVSLDVSTEWAGHLAYAPPPEWTADQRHNLANSILVEYVNTYDEWYRGYKQGGILSDIDSMIELTKLNYSGPGSWNDGECAPAPSPRVGCLE